MAFMWSSGVCDAVYQVICTVADTISLWPVVNNGVTLWAFSKPLERGVKVSLYEDVKWALILSCAGMCKNSSNFCSHFNKKAASLFLRAAGRFIGGEGIVMVRVARWKQACNDFPSQPHTHTKQPGVYSHNLDLSQQHTHFSVFPVNMILCLVNTHSQTGMHVHT